LGLRGSGRAGEAGAVTTLGGAARYRVEALAQLYFARWGIEMPYAHLKITMGLDVLTCKTVDGVLKALLVFAVIDNLVRLVMGQVAQRQHVHLDRSSFMGALRWLAAARDDEPLTPWWSIPIGPIAMNRAFANGDPSHIH
jgi:hypothetical protein